jgi:hypothetical protein
MSTRYIAHFWFIRHFPLGPAAAQYSFYKLGCIRLVDYYSDRLVCREQARVVLNAIRLEITAEKYKIQFIIFRNGSYTTARGFLDVIQ